MKEIPGDVREYMASIGSKGGTISRRTISGGQQKKLQKAARKRRLIIWEYIKSGMTREKATKRYEDKYK